MKTESELAFEEYLRQRGFAGFEYEPPIPGKLERPDYRLAFHGSFLYFDVKQFEPTKDELESSGGAFDPYSPIRWKIHEVWKQFKGLEEYPCALVLYDCGKPTAHPTPEIVLGAMLGNVGFRTMVDAKRGIAVGGSHPVFRAGGKMIRYESGRPVGVRNRIVSAILVIENLPVGMHRFLAMTPQNDQALPLEERCKRTMEAIERSRGTDRDVSLRPLRAVVHENPFATRRLPPDIFCGPYDERYGRRRNEIRRIFAGREIRKLELKGQVPKSPLDDWMRGSHGRGALSK